MAKRENIPAYIKSKFSELNNAPKNLEALFNISHNQGDRIFCEYIEKFIVKNFTYTDFKVYVTQVAAYLSNKNLINKHEYVGLLMENSLNWVALFWAILMLGGKPVLLNKKLPMNMLQDIASMLKIKVVISDSHVEKEFDKAFFFNNENKPLEEITKLEPLSNAEWEDEIVLTTTATSMNYKICVYKGADIFAQVGNAKGILAANKMIKEHYEGRLKVLAFLPFYHIFGLVAAYFWFSLFGRTFVFLKDYSSDTILKTVQRHKVTHIFAVPLLWNSIAKEVKKKIEQLEEKEKRRAYKGIKLFYNLQNLFPNVGRWKARKHLKQIQSQIFGDSVIFCITGGGSIPEETLYLMNAIGYPLYNGYGSTEIGITSVELRMKPKYRVLGTIGKPLDSVTYKIQDDELLVKGTSTCSKIIYKDGHEQVINKNDWFNTNDIARVDSNGYYYLEGRKDDIHVGVNGEKINPDEIEKRVLLTSVMRYCFTTYEGKLSLILQISRNNYTLKSETIINEVKNCLAELEKDGYHIDKVLYTFDNIASETAIKVSRKILDYLIENKKVSLHDFSEFKELVETKREDMDLEITNRIKKVFAEVLNKDINQIDVDNNFFYDLGGTSLDYMSLLMKLGQEFETTISLDKESCATVNDFYKYIMNRGN